MHGCCDGEHGCCKTQSRGLSWRWLASAIGLAVVVGLLMVVWVKRASADEDLQCFTREEVAKSVEDNKCLVIFEDHVYDLTSDAKKWSVEGHVDKHPCGQEYDTETIKRGPHEAEVMDKFLAGELCATPMTVKVKNKLSAINWRLVTSYLALIFFALNFATCYAMPWAKSRAPWVGEKPGADTQDIAGHFPLLHWHAYFAWAALFFLALHGLLGFACVFLGVCL